MKQHRVFLKGKTTRLDYDSTHLYTNLKSVKSKGLLRYGGKGRKAKHQRKKKSSLNVHSSLPMGGGLATDLKYDDTAVKVICTLEKSSSSSLR